MTIFFNIILSIFILLSFESTLVFVRFIKVQFFQPALYKFIILGFFGPKSIHLLD